MFAIVWTSLLLTALGGLTWWICSQPSFRVIHEPSTKQLRARRVSMWGGGVLGAALVAALVWTTPTPVAEAGEFFIRSSWVGPLLWLFFLWLAASGLIAMLWGLIQSGGYVPRPTRNSSPRIEARAGDWAEQKAAENPRFAVVGFGTFAALALATHALWIDRTAESTAAGLRIDGFLPFDVRTIPWTNIKRLDVTRDREAQTDRPKRDSAPAPWILTWTLQDGEQVVIQPDSLWHVSDAVLAQVEAHHAARAIPVGR